MKTIIEDKGIKATIDYEITDQQRFEVEIKKVIRQTLVDLGEYDLPLLKTAVDNLTAYNNTDIIEDYFMNKSLLILIAELRAKLNT